MTKTKSIQEILNPQEKSWKEISHIHDLQEEKSFVEMILCIAEYGFRRFFSEYPVFLELSYKSITVQNFYWEEAFQIFTDSTYSQLWQGLDKPPKEKKKSSKYEWYDNLVMGQKY